MNQPLAERMRPKKLEDVLGQDHLFGPKGKLRLCLNKTHLPSMILWGPPGSGKTTVARILAQHFEAETFTLSAIFSGVADLKKIFAQAEVRHQKGQKTVLFVDEIHRFNRAQQDAFLPFVERGVVTLIGATTENPSFALNGALLSRCQVFVLNPLSADELDQLMQRCEALYKGKLLLTEEAKKHLIASAAGDGRYLLNLLEVILTQKKTTKPFDVEAINQLVAARYANYDKHQDYHFNYISALHKSLRGSDEQAALYWFARMLEGGEDPLYIARRLIRFASEDIGMADPQALVQAMTARQVYEVLGSPEGELALVQAVIYLATAPKSNALYKAEKAVHAQARQTAQLSPPKHILNAPTKLMKEEGYGKGYQYDHDTEEGFSGQSYFPEEMTVRPLYYQPKEVGFEREVVKRLKYWDKLRAQQKKGP